MKIVNFKTFIAMPAGVIFSYYQPCIFEGLWRKEETINHNDGDPPGDYFQTSLLPTFDSMSQDVELSDLMERDGAFDYDRLYAVYEADDVARLKKFLESAVAPEITEWVDPAE